MTAACAFAANRYAAVAPSIFIIVSFFSFSFFTYSDSFGTCQYKRLLSGNADSTFQQVYDERFQRQARLLAPRRKALAGSLFCLWGSARRLCSSSLPDCKNEMFAAYPCKQRFTCRSCHQKRTLLTALHVAEEVCAPVAHRQVALTIPKRQRRHARFDRNPLGKLTYCVWTCIQKEVRRHLSRDDVVPTMVAPIQTHGELLHWHPHLHALVTCGAFSRRVTSLHCLSSTGTDCWWPGRKRSSPSIWPRGKSNRKSSSKCALGTTAGLAWISQCC